MVIMSAICGPGHSSAQDLKSVFNQCRGSKDVNIKAQSCSEVIQESKDRSQIERAYNSRGLANMALKNFSNAVQDFTRAIQMDAHNSGYVDNRQGAFFALGRFDLALADANNAIRLSPKEAFVYHSRGLIYGAIGKYNDAVNDISIAISYNPKWIESPIRPSIEAQCRTAWTPLQDSCHRHPNGCLQTRAVSIVRSR